MPDKKPTDAEIIKALECCADGSGTGLIKATLDLINRLQARLEKCEKVEHFADKTIATLQAENERLKKGWKADIQLTAEVKAEAYKEFAEKLKEKGFIILHHKMILSSDIDNLLKELVGEDNE